MDNDKLAHFFGISLERLSLMEEDFTKYSSYLKRIFSADKSLSLGEAFVLYLVVRLFGVKHIAELGVRYGISTRFWLKMIPDCLVDGYDIKKLYNKRLKHIKNSNFKFIKGDLHSTWSNKPYDLVFYDAHPYDLTHKIALAAKNKTRIHCFHDVGSKCYKPKSKSIPPKKRTEIIKAGHWERHIMYEVFTPDTWEHDLVIDTSWRSLIVDDRYGIGIVIHNSLIEGAK